MKVERARTDGKRMRYTIIGGGDRTSSGGTGPKSEGNIYFGFVDEKRKLSIIVTLSAQEIDEIMTILEQAKRRRLHGA